MKERLVLQIEIPEYNVDGIVEGLGETAAAATFTSMVDAVDEELAVAMGSDPLLAAMVERGRRGRRRLQLRRRGGGRPPADDRAHSEPLGRVRRTGTRRARVTDRWTEEEVAGYIDQLIALGLVEFFPEDADKPRRERRLRRTALGELMLEPIERQFAPERRN
jgi:hypothetical protein